MPGWSAETGARTTTHPDGSTIATAEPRPGRKSSVVVHPDGTMFETVCELSGGGLGGFATTTTVTTYPDGSEVVFESQTELAEAVS